MYIVDFECDQTRIRNFGMGPCATFFGWWKELLLVPYDWTMTPAEYADLQATLVAANINNNYDQRVYRLGPIRTPEAAYQDANLFTWGDGTTTQTRAAVAGWNLMFHDGGSCMATALQSLDQLEDYFKIMIFTSENVLLGTQVQTDNGIEMGGFTLSQLTAATPMVGVPDTPDQYVLNIQLYNKDEMFRSGMIIGYNFNIDKVLPNIQDVQLTQLNTINGSGVVNIGGAAGCGGTNIATGSLASTWANAARWIATNYETGAAITITTVTANASGYLVFDFDSADADYPTSGGHIALQTASVSTLATAGLRYYESYAPGTGVKLLIEIP